MTVCKVCGGRNPASSKQCHRCYSTFPVEGEEPGDSARDASSGLQDNERGQACDALPAQEPPGDADAGGPQAQRPPALLGAVIPGGAADTEPRTLGYLSLRCTNGDKPGLEYRLDRADMLVGRPDAVEGITPDIDLTDQEVSQPHPWVSRAHARVTWGPEGCAIVDLRSRNRTYVNDQELVPGKLHPIRAGDKVTIGRLVFDVTRSTR